MEKNSKKSGSKRSLEDDNGNKISKEEKLLKLMGGKKAKNATAANDWIKKTSDKEKVKKITNDLERQFNDSMQNKISGNTRMHTGIGFHEAPKPAENTHIKFDDSDSEEPKTTEKSSTEDKKEKPLHDNTYDNSSQSSATSKSPSIKTKKDFYAQFTKSSSGASAEKTSKNETENSPKKQIKTKKDFYSQFTKASS